MNSDDSVPENDLAARDADRPTAPDSGTDFERLFREHNHALLSYAYARVRSWADAKDVVQEAYVKVFDLGKDRSVSHVRAYLYKTVRNCAADWMRQRDVRDHFADLEYFQVDKESASAEHIWLVRDEIKSALEALPPKCRLAMILVNVRGLSYEEAAQCMRIKVPSVRRLVERSAEHLLEILHSTPRERRSP